VPKNIDACPDCGSDILPPGETHIEKAVLTGNSPSMLFARACIAVGQALTNLSKRI
jgi:hypothetical protein